ncbi:hypothetical protein DDP47_08360 [Helicobacter pylori]|nr:hypothetical protein DDP47_08360 [Helicobacter pylori]
MSYNNIFLGIFIGKWGHTYKNYGYYELAINYIENMHEDSFIYDKFLRSLLEDALKSNKPFL